MEEENEKDNYSSELGTKSYWDSYYARDLHTFDDTGDIGDTWFGEQSIGRVVKWIKHCDYISTQDRIIDIGCGNGSMLFALHRAGYHHLTGVDYSPDAIALARKYAANNHVDGIDFRVCDILSEPACDGLKGNPHKENACKLCIDKGTFDAIMLMPTSQTREQLRETYIRYIYRLLENHESATFIITSCNWTKPELQQHFHEYFHVRHVIPTPQMTFGGATGNTVTCIVFGKRIP